MNGMNEMLTTRVPHQTPLGSWPKDKTLKMVGSGVAAAMEADIEGYVGMMGGLALGWGKVETQVYCAKLRKEGRSGKIHVYYPQRIVWGQKPEA